MKESERIPGDPEPDMFIDASYKGTLPMAEVKSILRDHARLHEPPYTELLELRTQNMWWGLSLGWIQWYLEWAANESDEQETESTEGWEPATEQEIAALALDMAAEGEPDESAPQEPTATVSDEEVERLRAQLLKKSRGKSQTRAKTDTTPASTRPKRSSVDDVGELDLRISSFNRHPVVKGDSDPGISGIKVVHKSESDPATIRAAKAIDSFLRHRSGHQASEAALVERLTGGGFGEIQAREMLQWACQAGILVGDGRSYRLAS